MLVSRPLVLLGFAIACTSVAAPAAGQDLCAFIARNGPAVFGTPLQAAPQCDHMGDLTYSGSANNAAGSDRIEIAILNIPGVEGVLDQVRRDSRQGRVISDEPSLGAGALLERFDKGRTAVFHFTARGRYLKVGVRARDGLNDAYVARARQMAKALQHAS
jgi:hypothetical protein